MRLTEDKLPHRTVAAALSAAVTTTKPQETAPNSQAKPTKKKARPPNASCSSGERGLGGEGLLSEKPPLPPESPTLRLFGREREGGDFSSEKSSPSHLCLTQNRHNGRVGAAVEAGIKLNASLAQSVLCTGADAAADECVCAIGS